MAKIQDTRSGADLVTAARAGDRAAFGALIGRHYPMLHTVCTRVLGDQDQALDVAQEAAVTAMLGLGRLRHDDRFGAWLAGIGLNLCRRLLRDRYWAVSSLDALLDSHVISEPADDGRGPADAVEAAEAARRIRDAILGLPAGQRQAAEAYYLSGLTQAEAAVHLGVSPGAVKTRLHKARAALRASLSDYQPERYPAMTAAAGLMRPMTISGVSRRRDADAQAPGRGQYMIMLAETGGDRRMWIGVGLTEAAALVLTLGGTEMPRPITYQFTAALLTASGGRLREVRITSLTNGVFYAQAVLTSGVVVDARPSDALNLAAISDVPVYAAEELLELYARPPFSAESPGDWCKVTAVIHDPGTAHQPPDTETPGT